VPSPLGAEVPLPEHGESALDFIVDEATLQAILGEAEELSESMGQAVLV
jgi:hypothetical protein